MELQEAFDKIWNHFVVNSGERSFDGKACMYRGPNGSKCAIGVLISDEKAAEVEGLSLQSILQSPELPHYDYFKSMFEKHEFAYYTLQRMHDNTQMDATDNFKEYMRHHLTQFSFDWHVSIPGESA
jgi:hypothetical protein